MSLFWLWRVLVLSFLYHKFYFYLIIAVLNTEFHLREWDVCTRYCVYVCMFVPSNLIGLREYLNEFSENMIIYQQHRFYQLRVQNQYFLGGPEMLHLNKNWYASFEPTEKLVILCNFLMTAILKFWFYKLYQKNKTFRDMIKM